MNCHSNGCVQQSQLFTHLFKLLQALNFFVYHVPFVDKQIALWAQGLVHLTLIWHHGEHTFSGSKRNLKPFPSTQANTPFVFLSQQHHIRAAANFFSTAPTNATLAFQG